VTSNCLRVIFFEVRMNRKMARRKLNECRTHTAWIEYHLQLLSQEYRVNGKVDWADRFDLARELNIELDKLIEQLRDNL
jgi:hypothetical protein